MTTASWSISRVNGAVSILSESRIISDAFLGTVDDSYSEALLVNRSSPKTTSTSAGVSLNESTPERELVPCSLNTSEYFSHGTHVLLNASLEDASRLFPLYLAGAVKRVPDPSNGDSLAASIAMIFPDHPSTHKLGCQMMLEITANKVEHIAREIFQAHVETTAGLRYVCLPGGAKIVPNPQVIIQGCRHDIISLNFGTETFHAISANPVYKDEIKQGHDHTDCVSMVVPHNAHEGAHILLFLAPREGTLIRDRLYK